MLPNRNLLTTVTAVVLAAAALAPAATSAADVELAGAPTLRVLNDEVAGVQIAVDRKLARTKSGRARVRIHVGGRLVRRVETSGRHGDDVLYAGSLTRKGLKVGARYTIRIEIAGQRRIVRQVKLHPRRR
jgi:hypothetical protein